MNAAEDNWRPSCGGCGSLSISVTTGACDDCGLPWDGTESPEASRDENAEDAAAEAERYLEEYDDDPFSS